MTWWGRVLAGLGVAAGLAACVYYNGLYNANRLAGDARRAEREGRAGEARSLWLQAAVKAESVAVHERRDRQRGEALLLAGRAFRYVGECERAIAPLRLAADSAAGPPVRRRAQLLLGACYVATGQPDSAQVVLTPLVADPDTAVQREARQWRGRAALATGEPAAALRDLARTGPDAAFDIALAYVALDSLEPAVQTLAAGLRAPFDERRWRGALEALGRRAATVASPLVDALVARAELTEGQRARLLVADGERWAARSPARAAERFRAAQRAAPDSNEAGVALVRLAMLELERTADPARSADMLEWLTEASRRGGSAGREAATLVPVVREIHALIAGDRPADPLRTFRLAEAARDSLGAAPLAAALFVRIAAQYPESPLAPKALLAAALLAPARAESLVAVLRIRYPTSPYLKVLHGEGAAAFRELEDSLRGLLASAAPRTAEAPDVGKQPPIRRP